MKILIVDDALELRIYFTVLLESFGYEVIEAEDGLQAVQQFKDHHPDLVIMDCIMPNMNGMQATRLIREMTQEDWIPILLITSFDNQELLREAIECGADDFLPKPIQADILKVKLQGLGRGLEAWRLLLQQKQVLANYQFAMEDEKRVAHHLMQTLTDNDGLADSSIQWWIRPADILSGDVIAAMRTPLGDLHILLADGTGHGLNAALSALQLPKIFYAMTSYGFRIDSIAEEMNERTKEFLPIDRFFATTLLSLSSDGVLEVWNAGNPAPILVDEHGNVLHEFQSRHLPLGIMRNGPIDSHLERMICPVGSQLLVMSDGYIEARNLNNQEYGIEALKHSLIGSQRSKRLELLQNKIYTHLGQKDAHDDISVLLLNIDEVRSKVNVPLASNEPIATSESEILWSFQLTFNGLQLKKMSKNVIPLVMKTIEAMGKVKQEKLGALFLIVTELFNNALDHGLLDMQSKTKNLPDGFEQYLNLRTEKLSQLASSSWITIKAELHHHSMMLISVMDSGKGFDYQDWLTNCDQNFEGNSSNFHGRGINLILKLGVNLEFKGAGNEVLAYFSVL